MPLGKLESLIKLSYATQASLEAGLKAHTILGIIVDQLLMKGHFTEAEMLRKFIAEWLYVNPPLAS